MLSLENVTREEIKSIFSEKKNAEIEIPANITKFKQHIPDVDFSRPKEVPPTPVILNAEGIAQVIVYGGNGLAGKYMQLVVFVYVYGGQIFYTELMSGNYKAAIVWPAA